MSDAEVKDQAHASRRRFLLGSAKTACGVALFGLGLGFYGARQSEAMPYYAMRPPGALDEKRFLAACIRCGQCVRACPYSTLRLAAPEEKVATGTPILLRARSPVSSVRIGPVSRRVRQGPWILLSPISIRPGWAWLLSWTRKAV